MVTSARMVISFYFAVCIDKVKTRGMYICMLGPPDVPPSFSTNTDDAHVLRHFDMSYYACSYGLHYISICYA